MLHLEHKLFYVFGDIGVIRLVRDLELFMIELPKFLVVPLKNIIIDAISAYNLFGRRGKLLRQY
jgi:hypothetical protein